MSVYLRLDDEPIGFYDDREGAEEGRRRDMLLSKLPESRYSITDADAGHGINWSRYQVFRRHDYKKKHKDCRHFVLDLNHDKFSVPALRAYALACEVEYPVLAEELRKVAKEASELWAKLNG